MERREGKRKVTTGRSWWKADPRSPLFGSVLWTVVLCFIVIVFTSNSFQSNSQFPPKNTGTVPITPPTVSLRGANGDASEGITMLAKKLEPRKLIRDTPDWPVDKVKTVRVTTPLTFVVASERFPTNIEFRFVSRDNKELISPIMCSLLQAETWQQRDAGSVCGAKRGENGWLITLYGGIGVGRDLFMTVSIFWNQDAMTSHDVLTDDVGRYAFTASFLFRIEIEGTLA